MIRKLIPILRVSHLEAERDWYVRLGIEVSYEGPGFPGIIALGMGEVEFAVEKSEALDAAIPDKVLVW